MSASNRKKGDKKVTVNSEKVGARISALRKARGLTQNELGEKLNISSQAISKWERGEALPDTAILLDLAATLEMSVDGLLSDGNALKFKGKLSVKDMREGINCIERVGFLLGKQNLIYKHAIEGISEKMNTDIEAMFGDEYLRECLILEAMLQNIMAGYYFEPADAKANFKHEKWYNIFCEYAKKYDMKNN